FDVFADVDEKYFQAAWCDCLSALIMLKKMTPLDPAITKIWDLSLSLGALRYRISDKSSLAICQEECRHIAKALTTIIDQYMHAATIDCKPLDSAIQRLEDIYQNILQTASTEPLILLLFIQDLRDLQEVLAHQFPQNAHALKSPPKPLSSP